MTATDDIFSARAKELVLEKEIELQKLKNASKEHVQEAIQQAIIDIAKDHTDIIHKALQLGFDYGGIDGAYHKMWVIDQMIRILAGDLYDTYVKAAKEGQDGPDTYSWDVGIAP